MNPSFGRKPRTQLWASSNSACALLRALPTQTQENNYIWTLDSLISASAHAYTSSMTKTREWLLMPAKRCFPQNASIQTEKNLCFALCGPSSVSLITSVHRKSSSRLVTSQSPSSTVNKSEMAWWRNFEARYAQNYKSSLAACQNCSTDTCWSGCTPQQNRKNHSKWQITGTSRRMCVKECPQHMSMAAPTIARAIYKLERVWSGSTMTCAHRNNSN